MQEKKLQDLTQAQSQVEHDIDKGKGDSIEIGANRDVQAKEFKMTNNENQEDTMKPVSSVLKGDTEEQIEVIEKTEEGELVVIQETGFTIKVVCPGVETFDLQVSSMELVQEIYQVLLDKEDTCHRTCFSLQYDGTTLDNFAELKTIEGLQEGSTIKVVEEPYTAREARIHVRHIRDVMKSVDLQEAYNGVDCNSLSFLNVVTSGNLTEKKTTKTDSVDCTPPDYMMPCSKERPILPLHPGVKEQQNLQCLKVLTYSGWNPPPGNRRMHGDVLYLYVVTLEEKRFHITASTRGFYLNQSTQDDFNPRPSSQKHLSHSLVDLLSQVSPAFKKNFQQLLKKRSQKHPFERVATPYQVYSWLALPGEHTIDAIRAEDAFSSRLGYEEHIPGQTRDWNEELQTTRELPRKTLPERLIRERAIFKVHSDFVVAATRGATSVIDGNIMAINPGEDTKMQMYLWNNIFFSLGFDVKDHYKEFGGDCAAYAAPGNDLQGVKAYASTDIEGLYTLGTVVVDYRGYRVTAQSIIPGILEREQEQSVVYGSIDFGKTVVTHEKYRELLKKTSHALKICPHVVTNEKGEDIELFSSVECKGIIGNDGRHYVLDMLRTFPPDVNYLSLENEELSKEMTLLGYPKKHPHRLVCLRQELVEAFTENRYVAFVKHAALNFQHLRQKQIIDEQKANQEKKKLEEEANKENDKIACEKDMNCEEKNSTEKKSEIAHKISEEESTDKKSGDKSEKDMGAEEAKKLMDTITDKTYEESGKEIIQKAAKSVNSLKEDAFDITFNPDVFQPIVKHGNTDTDVLQREKLIVKDASEFLVLHQIPSFIHDCLEHTSSPIDGYTLSEALQHNGINMRYLGKVTETVAKYSQLSYLHSICVCELVCRTAKHLYKLYMQSTEMMSLSAAISHFLNCLLGSYPTPHTQLAMEELQSQKSKKRNKKKNKGGLHFSGDNTEWATETPKMLWRKLLEEMKSYFHYELDCDCIDTLVEKYDIQKTSLLRSLCKKVGIQVMLKEYNMDKTKQAFSEEDILNVFPIVKHIAPKASDAYHVFTSGQNKIKQGLLRDGYEHISEALNLLNNVYGAMHPEIAACCRLLARLNYIMGDYPEALLYQQRAVLMSERVLGIDHPNTITEYAHMALYCFANNQISPALKLMYRARYLALLCHGENHPEVALFDSNIGLILHAVGEFDLSLRFLQCALDHNTNFFGMKSLKVAMNYHLVARAHSCKGDFRTALQYEKEAYSIYKTALGEEHDRTKESTECLKHLTQQAVKFQKTMNQLSRGEKLSSIPPLQIQTPSLANVLDTLNLINGIVFLHISTEDIEKFREEMMLQQQQQQQKIAHGSKLNPKDTSKTDVTSQMNKPNGTDKTTSDTVSSDNSPSDTVPSDKIEKSSIVQDLIDEPMDR